MTTGHDENGGSGLAHAVEEDVWHRQNGNIGTRRVKGKKKGLVGSKCA